MSDAVVYLHADIDGQVCLVRLQNLSLYVCLQRNKWTNDKFPFAR
jgi:hypothetical protein